MLNDPKGMNINLPLNPQRQMINKNLVLATFITLAFFIQNQLFSQIIGTDSSFKVTVDLVSHYVWRGSMATGSPTPNIQPAISYTIKNFEIGVWGSTDFAGSYKEVDPYVAYSAGNIKFMVTDYNWDFDKVSYFNYENDETSHRLEGTVAYSGPESFPVSVSLNTMFYGLDKKADDAAKQAYSTYIELGYTKNAASVFFGFTPSASFYNNYGVTAFDSTAAKKTFSIVNIGGSITKSIKISNKFSLPVKATLVVNPSATYSRKDFLHLVVGITF